MRNTFNTKNTYENILTGINKEELSISCLDKPHATFHAGFFG
jgi:hypothetical protein